MQGGPGGKSGNCGSTDPCATAERVRALKQIGNEQEDRHDGLAPAPLGLRLLSALPFVFAAVIGAFVTVATFWPGYMSTDSLRQFMEARVQRFTDWHPPLMSWLWARLDSMVPGPGGMLVFQNVCFWTGLALLVHNCFRSMPAAAAVLVIGFLPPVFGLLSTIWKDVGFGACLLLAYALMQRARIGRSQWVLWTSLVPLAYGTLIRHNGLFAALPLALWWGKLFSSINPRRWARRWVVNGTIVFVALLFSFKLVNWALTDGRSQYLQQHILLHDLAAISVQRKQNLLPPYIRNRPDAVSLDRLTEIYHPSNTVTLWCCSGQRLPLTTDPAEFNELTKYWLTAVLKYPGPYLRHRWGAMRSVLGMTTGPVSLPFYGGIDANPFGFHFVRGRWNTWVMARLESVMNSLLFRGWAYVLEIALLLAICRRFRPQQFESAVVLGSSALLYTAAYFPLSALGDFRYVWWTVLVGWVLPLVVFSTTGAQATATAGGAGQLRSSRFEGVHHLPTEQSL